MANLNDNDELSVLIVALKKSTFAFYELLRNLENDGYIKAINGASNPVSADICAEVAGVSVGVLMDYMHNHGMNPDESQTAIDVIVNVLNGIVPVELIEASIVSNSKVIASTEDAYKPEGYMILNSFDQMSQSFEGAFYNNMKVENPGNISEFYKELLDGYIQLICDILGKDIVNYYTDKVDLVYG